MKANPLNDQVIYRSAIALFPDSGTADSGFTSLGIQLSQKASESGEISKSKKAKIAIDLHVLDQKEKTGILF